MKIVVKQINLFNKKLTPELQEIMVRYGEAICNSDVVFQDKRLVNFSLVRKVLNSHKIDFTTEYECDK